MLRFLGKDFYEVVCLASAVILQVIFEKQKKRREQASLTASDHPCCPGYSSIDSVELGHHKINVQQLLNELTEKNVLEEEKNMNFDYNDNTSRSAMFPEKLEWGTVWKIINGELTEVVPSSNPDSFCSSCNDEIQTPVDLAPNIFTKEPFINEELMSSYEGTAGQLEEPILQDMPKHSSTLSEAMQQVLQFASFENPLLVSNKVSERDVFGKEDQQFEDEANVEYKRNVALLDNKLKIIPDKRFIMLQKVKAEELMSPTCVHPSPVPSSPQNFHVPITLKQAHAACRALISSCQYLQIDENEDYKDKSELDVSSIMKTQAKSDLIENLLTSPVKRDDIKTFVDVIGSPENIPTRKTAELESPMELLVSHSSLQLTDKYCKATASSLKEWSPDLLCSNSPFLSIEEKGKLEKLLRHDEECVRDILLMKLKEPDTSQHLEIKDKQNIIGNALLVACQHDVASGLGKLELNLSWNILPKERLLTHEAHEKMIIPENIVQEEKWKNPETPLRMENLETQDDYLEMHPRDDFLNSRIQPNFISQILPSHKNAGNKSDEGKSSEEISKEQPTSEPKFLPNSSQNTFTKVFKSHESPLDMSLKVCSIRHSELAGNAPVSSFKVTLTSCSNSVKKMLSSESESSCHTTKESTTSNDTDAPNRDQFSIEDFDLQYDEQECYMDSDSSEDALKTSNEMQTYCDNDRRCSSKLLSPCSKKLDMNSIPFMQVPDLPFDSVDSFVMMRETKVSLKPEKAHSLAEPGPSVHCGSSQFQRRSVLTPMSAVPKCLMNSEAKANSQKFISLTLSGMFAKVHQLLVTEAKPRVLHLIHNGILQSGANFSSMRSDYTRFLLKEITARLNNVDENLEDELFRNILTVHILRVATDLLINCCFESTIVYIGNMQEKYPWLSGRLDGLRKEMFKQQFMMQQSGVFHPKIAAVCREIQHSDIKHCLVIVRNYQPLLLKTLQAAVTTNGNNAFIMEHETICSTWPSGFWCLITWKITAVTELLSSADIVIEYEASKDSDLYKKCLTANIPYVGIIMDPVTTQCEGDQTCLSSDTFTVIGSETITAFQDLLHLLETRHNILVLARDYQTVKGIHFADILLDFIKGIVLLDVNQLSKDGAFENLIVRMAGIGLHLSQVWILLYNLSNNTFQNRQMFEGGAFKQVAQLQGLLANLSKAAADFHTLYKVIFCSSVSQLAATIHKLTKLSRNVDCGDGTIGKHLTSFLSHEMSSKVEQFTIFLFKGSQISFQGEKFLIGIPCLNSFSAQLLLSRATVGQLMIRSLNELVQLAPELPTNIIKNMYKVLTMDNGLKLRLNGSYNTEEKASPPPKLYCPSSRFTNNYDLDSEMKILEKKPPTKCNKVQQSWQNQQYCISGYQTRISLDQNDQCAGELSHNTFLLSRSERPSPEISNKINKMDDEHWYCLQNFPESLSAQQTCQNSFSLSTNISRRDETHLTSPPHGGITDNHKFLRCFSRQIPNNHDIDNSEIFCPWQRQDNKHTIHLDADDLCKSYRKNDTNCPTFFPQTEPHGQWQNLTYLPPQSNLSKNSTQKILQNAVRNHNVIYPSAFDSDCLAPNECDRFSLSQFRMNNKSATQGTAPRIKPWFPDTASSNIQDLNTYRDPMQMIPSIEMPNKMDHRKEQSFTQELIAATHNLLHGSSQDFFCDRQKLSGFWRYPHRVSIGLAQPLRRNTPDERKNEPQESVQKTCPSQHESQQQQNSSPPIEIPDIDSAGNRKINKPGYVPMKKLKKWSHQCASKEATHTYNDPGANGADNDHLRLAKRKPQEARLTYQPVPGAGGQTKLVFH